MVDPRIYRAGLAVIAVAVIVFAFSLQTEPSGGAGTAASSTAFSGAGQTLATLGRAYPDRAAGSAGDDAAASWVAQQFRAAGGFSVTEQSAPARTAGGEQDLTTVTATRTGLAPGTIVVFASRDATSSPGLASLSGTVALVDLARALSGGTLNRTLMLVSTSGSVGAAGARQLAASLAGSQVDAVIGLGDLVAAHPRRPIVVPWSSNATLAPAQLQRTLGGIVTTQTGLSTAGPDLASQLAHLAVPFSLTGQAPLGGAGIPAVTLSLAGDRLPASGEQIAPARLAGLAAAVLQTVGALESGAAMPVPSAYLALSGHLIPMWAIRMLVLALILPAAAVSLDAVARARRRGHSLRRWILWVLAGAVPFALGLLVPILGRLAGAFDAPSGPVGGTGVAVDAGGAAVLALTAVVIVVAFIWVRPACLRAAAAVAGPEAGGRAISSPPIEGASVALSAVMCALAVVLWIVNPFAALLLVPALHLWLWLAQARLHEHRLIVAGLVLGGLIAPTLVCLELMRDLGLSPLGLVWSVALFVGGGGLSILAGVFWCLVLGGLASAVVIAVRSAPAGTPVSAGVSVRGPATYAGPGSLGGTKSALRR